MPKHKTNNPQLQKLYFDFDGKCLPDFVLKHDGKVVTSIDLEAGVLVFLEEEYGLESMDLSELDEDKLEVFKKVG